jgi:hypothetical protein
MHLGEFGWTLARWNLLVIIAAAILTFAVGAFDPAVASLG